ncbi:ribulose-phosphate 3-epimerase [Labrys monachus]|uniref:Ribulose-phosphate 3-epimerase n=1 Tax=Labrys monachus TaxID=217067 RepID=A0ABU0FNM9_9HYPH|nr:ribulose-phosphate 3-epimerase [Labrys monachus]MDQ0396217.1 ribulose-phosphate 3-epimerase [Labrys monachus]
MKPPSGWLDTLPADRLLAEFSLWSADLGRLADDIARVEPHVDIFHIDVADGHFSPSMLYFPDLVAAVRRQTAKPLHVHLMTADAILIDQIGQFAEAGADLISLHAENANADEALGAIERLGLAAGMVLQLHTPVAAAAPFLDRLAMLTLLGTRMGIKGVGLDDSATARLREARRLLAGQAPRRIVLAADGGIRENTVPDLRRAGAETIVMGSLAFGAPDLAARMAWVHGLEREA